LTRNIISNGTMHLLRERRGRCCDTGD